MAASPDEMVMVYIPDHEALAHDLLLFQQKQRPRFEAFVASLAASAQMQENMIWSVLVGATTLQGSEGVNLDRWGAIVGEIRGGLSEEEYLRFIALRIRVNTTKTNDYNTMWTILDDALDLHHTVTSYFVTDGVVFEVLSDDWLDRAVGNHAGALIRDVRAAGIYAAVVEFVESTFPLVGSIAEPGMLIGSIADPGDLELGRLLYDGRSRQ